MPGTLRKAWAFIKRDFQSESSYKLNYFLHVASSLLSIVLFYFLSRIVDSSQESLAKYGGNYFSFVLIGLAFSRYFQLALGVFSGSIQRAQATGCLEAMLSTQTSPQACVLFSSLYALIESLVQLAIVLAAGVLFFEVDFTQANIPATLIIFVLALLTFVSLGVMSAAGIVVLKKGDPVGWVLTSASMILGGAYFPIEVMPGWLQAIAKIIPATYALDALRLTMLRGHGLGDVSSQVLILGAMVLVLLPVSLRLFDLAVNIAKKDGTLAQY
ncbi:MAG: ABC transporter permease [Candidatus Hydrogenedentales bacterium]|jgi:ABC-2 type transport system permease protein